MQVIICLLLSSCAIHKDFPFICFRWGCFAKQVGLPSGKAIKKQVQINAKVRKKKREAKKRKKNKPEPYIISDKKGSTEEAEKSKVIKKDTSVLSYFAKGNANYLILVFLEAHPPGEDSLLINYPENREFSEYEKSAIKNFVDSVSVGSGDAFIIKEYSEYLQPELKGRTKAKEKLFRLLNDFGIAPKRIRFSK